MRECGGVNCRAHNWWTERRTETGNWVGIKLDYLSIVVELRRGESFLDRRCLINCRIMTLTLNKYNEGITITIIISTFRTNPFSAIVIEDDEDSLLVRTGSANDDNPRQTRRTEGVSIWGGGMGSVCLATGDCKAAAAEAARSSFLIQFTFHYNPPAAVS